MRPITSDDWMGEKTLSALGFKNFKNKDTDTTAEWLVNYTPFKCSRCGHYSDTRTPYCAYCGKEAINVADP